MGVLGRTPAVVKTLAVLVMIVNSIQGAPVIQTPHNESQPNSNTNVEKSTKVTNAEAALTPEFVRKVFSAFFEELKNRPDVVDEILKQEAYRMLETWAEEEGELDPFTPELGNLPNINSNQPIPDPEYYTDNTNVNSSPNSQGDTHNGEKRNNEEASTKLESAQTNGDEKTITNAETPTYLPDTSGNQNNAKTDELPVSNFGGNKPGNTLDPEPYYYYLYYDENENQKPSLPTMGEEHDTTVNSGIDDDKTNVKMNGIRTQMIGGSFNQESNNRKLNDSPVEIEPEDVKLERMFTAVKDKIADRAIDSSAIKQKGKVTDSDAALGFKTNENPSEEETELASLVT